MDIKSIKVAQRCQKWPREAQRSPEAPRGAQGAKRGQVVPRNDQSGHKKHYSVAECTRELGRLAPELIRVDSKCAKVAQRDPTLPRVDQSGPE